METQIEQTDTSIQQTSFVDYLKFIVPSLAGVLIFLFPINVDGSTTILFGILSNLIKTSLASVFPFALVTVTAISAIFTLFYTYVTDNKKIEGGVIAATFVATPVWVVLRCLGAIFAAMVVFQVGPEFIISDITGGTVMDLLAPNLLFLFLLAALCLPLLTEYGFMEFFGTLVSPFFLKVFRLPGRSAIDGLASWLGSAVIGVVLTVQQYAAGTYSQREAACVATNFSIVSLPFCLVITEVVGLQHVFWQYYFSVIFIGVLCALIMPRILPLTRISNEYSEATGKQVNNMVNADENLFTAGVRLGLEKAKIGPNPIQLLKTGMENVANLWFTLFPATLAIATIALILVEYTSLFQIISSPLVPILEMFGIEEAAKAAPAFIVGFADMYLPALIGKGIESEVTRFLIAILSVSQLIYMSEIGAVLLRAKMGLNFGHLVLIFVIRTVIAAPIAIILAKYVIF